MDTSQIIFILKNSGVINGNTVVIDINDLEKIAEMILEAED